MTTETRTQRTTATTTITEGKGSITIVETIAHTDSVEIERTAKGDAKVVVKCYRANEREAGDAALAEYRRLMGELNGGPK